MKTKAWISLFYPVHPVHPCSNFAFLMLMPSHFYSDVQMKPAYAIGMTVQWKEQTIAKIGRTPSRKELGSLNAL